jgi:hypothetical protein
VKFETVSYVVYATGKGFEEQSAWTQNSGAYFNGEAKRILDKCRPGSTVVLDEIKVKGPDGIVRQLGSLAFNLY